MSRQLNTPALTVLRATAPGSSMPSPRMTWTTMMPKASAAIESIVM